MGQRLISLVKRNLGKLIRYGLVGVGSNLLFYGAYIGLTLLGMIPELAMTVLYGAYMMLTYILNRNWSFRSTDGHSSRMPRYVFTYVAGYAAQLIVLSSLYHLVNVRHEIAQLFAMVAAALTIFTLLNVWVFGHGR